MADRELSNKLASGEIGQMKIGGTDSGKIVQIADDLIPLQNSVNDNIVAIDDNKNSITDLTNRGRLYIQTSVDIDTLTKEGIYEVDTNLPFGWTAGEMTVKYYINHNDAKRVLQTVTNIFTGEKAERVASDYTTPNWGFWNRVTQDAQTSEVLEFKDQVGDPAYQEGIMYYQKGTHKLRGKYSDVTLDIGKEQWIDVVNDTAFDIPNGTPVRLLGINSGIPQIGAAIANSFENARVFGMTTHDIAAGTTGIVTTFGLVGDVDTNAFALNDNVYLSDTVSGGLTTTAPDIVTFVGVVTEIGATGKIFCKPQNNMSLPNALSFVKGHTMPDLTLPANTPVEITGYESELSVYGENSIADGTIRVYYSGVYTLSTQVSGTFSDEEVNCIIDLYDKDIALLVDSISFSIGRGSNTTAVPMSQTFNTVVRLSANTDYVLRYTSTTAESLSDVRVSFGVTSVHLDF